VMRVATATGGRGLRHQGDRPCIRIWGPPEQLPQWASTMFGQVLASEPAESNRGRIERTARWRRIGTPLTEKSPGADSSALLGIGGRGKGAKPEGGGRPSGLKPTVGPGV
jgi:hypothetical protein